MSSNSLSTPISRDGTDLTQKRSGSAPVWLVSLAKAGYAARGLIYVLIGILALLQAVGGGGESTDSKGAILQVLEAPGGIFILWAIVVGLVGYASWRFVQSVLDADNHGSDAKGCVVRAGLAVSAVTHLLLAFAAAKIALNTVSSDGGQSKESLVAKVLGWPGGQWIVGLIGLAIAGAGIAHIVKATKEKYKKHLSMDDDITRKVNPICKFGLFARGIAFFILAGMFVFAALTHDPDKAGGMEDVLKSVSNQPFGPYLLGVLAVGFIAFGVYGFIEAMYRKIDYK